MSEMHDPYEDQLAAARYRAERDMLAQAMERVADDIEWTFLGFEGAEDAPAMRWAREFRAALGSLHAPGFQKSRKVATALTSHSDASDVTMSAYDLLPKEDREAIAWVREHGGLERVKAQRRESMPRAAYERKKAGFLDHIAECEAALGRRNRRIDELEGRVKALTTENAELRKRLMPEGMEWLVEAWPRFEDNEPVRFLDDFERCGDESSVSVVTMYQDGSFALNFRAYSKGERVNRPAPKVLDADGVEIRVGDTVYSVEDGTKYEVCEVGLPRVTVEYWCVGITAHSSIVPNLLTHRAPVLAADGKPLREGQTVWDTNGDELVIGELEDGGHTVTCRYADVGDAIPVHGMWSPSDLTHERPVADTWERLEEDASLDPFDYCVGRGVADMGAGHLEDAHVMARDLVRRCKALAERDR